MTKGRRLDESEYRLIIELREKGRTLKSIGKQLKCSKNTVWATINRLKKTGSCLPRERVAKKKLMSQSDDHYVKLCSKRDRRKTLPVITQEFNLGRVAMKQSPVSKSTIRRSLLRMKMKGRVAAKKPLLRKENVRKRLAFCKKHRHWTEDQWRKVLWTDESKFELFGSKRRVFVRRLPNERFSKNCLTPTMKHGGGSIMVWGGMCSSGVIPLYRIKGIMDKERYHSILVHHAVPGGLKLLGSGFIFQQDNDPKHTAIINKKYLASKEKQGKNNSQKKT